MKYEICVSKIEYGFVTVEAENEEDAKNMVVRMDEEGKIQYHESEFSDISVKQMQEKLWYGSCSRCGYEFNKTRKYADDNIEYCPDCGEPFRVTECLTNV